VARGTSPAVALIASGACLLLALAATYRLSIAAPEAALAPAAASPQEQL